MFTLSAPIALVSDYNRETLEGKVQGKNISEVLEMTISQAVEFLIPSHISIRK